jgi:hypothetical protein
LPEHCQGAEDAKIAEVLVAMALVVMEFVPIALLGVGQEYSSR